MDLTVSKVAISPLSILIIKGIKELYEEKDIGGKIQLIYWIRFKKNQGNCN